MTSAAVYFHQVWNDEPIEDAKVVSIVGLHDNGYPEGSDGVLARLGELFSEDEDQNRFSRSGTAFGDAGLLAARFIVREARRNARLSQSKSWAGFSRMGMTLDDQQIKALDFRGIRPLTEEYVDIEFRYHVWCYVGSTADYTQPAISYEEGYQPWADPILEIGPGLYRITCEPLSYGDFKDVAEVVWQCNHLVHARNKANKKGLIVKKIQRVDEEE